MTAAWEGCSREIVACFIAEGADPNIGDKLGCIALHPATYRDHVQTVAALLDFGAEINARDNDGDAIIHQALFSHSDNTLELLLQRGAAYSLKDSMGNSVLHLAALAGGFRTLDILLAARLVDLDPDTLNGQGMTAMELAQARADRSESFLDKLQELCDGIRARVTEQAPPLSEAISIHITNAVLEDRVRMSHELPLLPGLRSLSRKASINIAQWTWPRWTRPAWPASPFPRIPNYNVMCTLPNRIQRIAHQHIWRCICLTWICGILCGGLVSFLVLSSVLGVEGSHEAGTSVHFGRHEHHQEL